MLKTQKTGSLLSKSLFENLTYQNDYLQPDKSSSSAFLNDIAFKVPVNQLYKLKSTCAYNSRMEYQAVQFQIVNPYLREQYGGNYLLQVWDKQGKIFYEKVLQAECKVWQMQFKYFIYKPASEEDMYHDCYHILSLEDSSLHLIRDWINDGSYIHVFFQYEGYFFVANQKYVNVIHVPRDLQPRQVSEPMEVGSNFAQFEPGLKIWGLAHTQEVFEQDMFYMILETVDSQLDFNKFIIKEKSISNFKYELVQSREVNGRQMFNNPIKKVFFVFHNKVNYSVALRKLGDVDIYWNMQFVDSSYNLGVTDINLSFDTMYFQITDQQGQVAYKCLQHSYEKEMRVNQMEDIPFADFDIRKVFYQRVKMNVNMFESSCLIRTNLWVAHNKFISVFNILKNKWINHCKFAEYIQLFRKKEGEELFSAGVMYPQGEILTDVKKIVDAGSSPDGTYSFESHVPQYRLKGKPFQTIIDVEDNRWFMFLSQTQDGEVHFETLFNDKLYAIEGVGHLKPHSNVVVAFAPDDDTVICVQNKNKVRFYHLTFDSNSNSVQASLFKTLKKIPTLESKVHSVISNDMDKYIFLVDNSNIYKYHTPTGTTETFHGHSIQGLYLLDDNYCYTLSHSSSTRKSGLRLYDLNNMISVNSDNSYHLTDIQVGVNTKMDFSRSNARLTFQKWMDELIIIPTLHRPTLSFLGMPARKKVVASRLIQDRFIVLDNSNTMNTWDAMSGQLLQSHKYTKTDYTKYQIHDFESEDQSLIHADDPIRKRTIVEKRDFDDAEDDSEEEQASEKEESDIEEDDEEEEEVEEPKEPISRHDKPYRLGLSNFTLLRSKQSLKDVDRSAFYKEEQMHTGAANQVPFVESLKTEFHEFVILRIGGEKDLEEVRKFVHPYHPKFHSMFFSEKCDYMLESLENDRIFLYKWDNNRWKLVKRMVQYPAAIENFSIGQVLMTPSFEYYLNFNTESQCFEIVKSLTQEREFVIPQEFMAINDKSEILSVVNRFQWVSNNMYKFITRSGIERLIQFDDKGNFQEVNFAFVPDFDLKETVDEHYYTGLHHCYTSDQIEERLFRKYRIYKSIFYMMNFRHKSDIYPKLFNVDYYEDDCKGRIMMDMSFTYLNWKIIEELRDGFMGLEDIDASYIKQLCYTILPEGQTIMHLLANKGGILKGIFEKVHLDDDDRRKKLFEVPFLPNMKGETLFNLCVSKKDFKTVDDTLEYLSGYGPDHHSRGIISVLPVCLTKNLPRMMPYLQSRMITTKDTEKIKRAALRPESTGMCASSYFIEHKVMDSKIFDREEKIEQEVLVEFLDIPKIHDYQEKEGEEFFAALADLDDFRVFEQKVIQNLIDFKYPLALEYTLKRNFAPFLTYQIVLITYLNYVLQAAINNPDDEAAYISVCVFNVLLTLLSLYFLKQELSQITNDFFDYWKDVWNYFDFIPPILIITMCFMDQEQLLMKKQEEPVQVAIQAIATLMIWLKFLYYLRIFKETSSLIRMIMQVIFDIRYFLMVLLLTIIAFGDSFKTLSNGNSQGERFVEKGFFGSFFYVYNMCLGDFSTEFGDVQVSLVWFMFFMCTMFNMIIMLNLLISIISESYEKISANINAAAYQEKSGLISENSFMIPQKRKDDFCDANKFLVVTRDVSGEVNKDDDEFVEAMETLRKQIVTKIEGSQKQVEKIVKKEIEQTEAKVLKKLGIMAGDQDGEVTRMTGFKQQKTVKGSVLKSSVNQSAF